jgi:hypothetical protein
VQGVAYGEIFEGAVARVGLGGGACEGNFRFGDIASNIASATSQE